MKRTGVILLAAVVAATLSQAQADDKKSGKDGTGTTEEVKQLDRKLTEAIVKGDVTLLERHLSDDFVVNGSTGHSYTKKQNIEALKSGTLKFSEINDSEVKARAYGHTAVLTGLSQIKGKSKTHEISGSFRWTRVYVHRDKHWECVVEQLTRVWTPDK